MISGTANIREAMKHFEAALPLANRAGAPVLEGDALTGMGRASQDLGEAAKALDTFRQTIAK